MSLSESITKSVVITTLFLKSFHPHPAHYKRVTNHISSQLNSSISLPMEAEPVGFLFFLTILNWVIIKTGALFDSCNVMFRRPSPFHKPSLSGEEVEMIMGSIGMYFSEEDEKMEMMDSEDLSAMFEEKEPTMEELRQSFSVFDQNSDGFIDAGELHRLLSKLEFIGTEETTRMEECQSMIRVHDVNRDGFIDFDEFVNLVESSFT